MDLPASGRLLGVHAQATRPGRILLALDTSGSMGQALPGGEATRFPWLCKGFRAWPR